MLSGILVTHAQSIMWEAHGISREVLRLPGHFQRVLLDPWVKKIAYPWPHKCVMQRRLPAFQPWILEGQRPCLQTGRCSSSVKSLRSGISCCQQLLQLECFNRSIEVLIEVTGFGPNGPCSLPGGGTGIPVVTVTDPGTHPAFYSMGTGDSFFIGKWLGREANNHFHLVPSSRLHGAISPLSHTPSWRGDQLSTMTA
jgi:hypothetical protein